mmetsp:Transcript_94595/g.287403  ORF Transcript_94595/g.287403 Transcript_94595/m.287403 type:complete len:224 (-) Transcript_94595:423-1094(-)
MSTLRTAPNCEKCSSTCWGVAFFGRPPTNILSSCSPGPSESAGLQSMALPSNIWPFVLQATSATAGSSKVTNANPLKLSSESYFSWRLATRPNLCSKYASTVCFVQVLGRPPTKTLGPTPPLVPGRRRAPPSAGPGGAKGSAGAAAWACGLITGIARCAAAPGMATAALLAALLTASASRALSTLPSMASECSTPLRALMQSSASLKELKVTKAQGLESAVLA